MTIIGPSLSGATLWIRDGTLHKVATGAGAERLQVSAKRQSEFAPTPTVRAPEVINVVVAKGRTHVEMEHVRGVGLALVCDSWLEHAMDVIVFIDECVHKTGQLGRVPVGVLLDKVATTLESVRKLHGRHHVFESSFERVVSLIDDARDVSIPVGYYHGDLTFCNVLCDCARAKPSIALIDFLDMVIPTPLFDIAKIRQDTHRKWITLFTPEVQPSRLTTIDALVLEYFSGHEWWVAWYPVFDLLNLLRLLPYAPPGRVVEWVTAELERELR